MITAFKGEFFFLSNFYPVTITVDNIDFPSVEHAYVAAKTNDIETKRFIANISTPGKVKRFGRTLELVENWDNKKVIVMKDLLKLKFNWTLNPLLSQKLTQTYPQHLIEGNTWGDKFWGMNFINNRWVGENILGVLLMNRRLELTLEVMQND